MSYDIWLAVDTGGEELAALGCLDWNYTSNCGPMWRAAGADIAEFHGKPASECHPILAAAITELETNPDKYIAMNPENGWGSYETLLPRLRELAFALDHHPKAIVQVWR